jgi:peptidylprolyl isomerase
VAVKKGDTVTIHYSGQLEDGTIFDSSLRSGPLRFTVGAGEVMPGLDQAVVGMQPDEVKRVAIPAEQAFGLYHNDLVVEVERDEIPMPSQPESKQYTELPKKYDRPLAVEIEEESGVNAKVDANHPLAGHDVVLTIRLIEIA